MPFVSLIVRVSKAVIENDISCNINQRTINSRFAGINFDRVYFADDTLLISTNTQAANNLLHEVEAVSAQFGLRLNREKCCYVAMNGHNVVKFADGTRLKRVNEATYLGHQITQAIDIRHEINHKMHDTLKVWYKLTSFWKAVQCPAHWKLHVYDAIIRNKLLYGLETIHLTQAMQKKINAFQLRGIRRILGLDSTYVNRANTNDLVLRKANEEMEKYKPNSNKIKLFSELVREKRIKLAGHILRTSEDDPLRQVSYKPNSANTYEICKRRVGGPRQNWLVYTNKYIWENKVSGPLTQYVSSGEQNQRIFEEARTRQF